MKISLLFVDLVGSTPLFLLASGISFAVWKMLTDPLKANQDSVGFFGLFVFFFKYWN